MTRTPYDQFAKQYLAELLAPLGEVETSREVAGEVRQVDVWFAPAPAGVEPASERQILGLLGQMASSACLLEPFRNQPAWVEIRSCLLKLFSIHSEMQRKARREENSLPEADLPRLWVLSPSCSPRLLEAFGATADTAGNWPEGVYFLPAAMKTALVAINQLPCTQETLWLRLLGNSSTQRQAVNEVTALPPGHPLLNNILELLSNWRITVEASQNLSDDERELIMNLSPAYLKWREDTLLEGMREERRATIDNLIRVRFGELDEELSAIIEPLLQLPPEEFTRLLLTLSREELLAQFGTQNL